MSERPILFSDAMVRAILAGTKTQTRRVLSPQPDEDDGVIACGAYHPIVVRRGVEEPGPERWGASTEEQSWPCPYGRPGDRLWVREAHAQFQIGRDPLGVAYRSTCDGNEFDYVDGFNSIRRVTVTKWTPSIHMPRWASRLTLEVTSVRVERVQSISEEDARAEGVSAGPSAALAETPIGVSAREAFAELWDSINGERAGCSWEANPWVWVVGFKRVEAT